MSVCPDCGRDIPERFINCRRFACRIARLDRAAEMFPRRDPTWELTPHSWNMVIAEIEAWEENARRNRKAVA